MIGLEDRQALARDIGVAQAAGARLQPACEIAGIDARTLKRWKGGQSSMPLAFPRLLHKILHGLAHRGRRSSQATPADVDKSQRASHTEILTPPRSTP